MHTLFLRDNSLKFSLFARLEIDVQLQTRASQKWTSQISKYPDRFAIAEHCASVSEWRFRLCVEKIVNRYVSSLF